MNTFLHGLRRGVAERPRAVLATILVLTIVFGWLSTMAQEASGDITLSTGSEAALTSDSIAELFAQNDDTVVSQVIVTAADVVSPDGIAAASQLRTAIAADPAIAAAALSGPGAVVTWADPILGAAAERGLDPLTLDDAAIDAIYAEALAAMPQAAAAQVGMLASADTDTGMVLVMLDGSLSQDTLDAALLAFGDLTVDAPVELHPFNAVLLEAESQGAVESQMASLLLLAVGLIVLILIAINRNVVDVVSSLAGLIFAIVWMNGIGTLLGPGFLEITDGMGEMAMAIPILLVGLGVDYGIHLASRYREERAEGASPSDAAGQAIGAVGAALTLATLTTVVGFLTNLANPLAPLQDFGILAAVGVIAAFLIMTTLVPAARLLADQRWERRHQTPRVQPSVASDEVGLLGRIAASIAPVATTKSVALLSVVGVLTIAAGFSATGLSTEFSQTEFLPEGSEAVATIELMSEEFGGDLAETTQVLVQGDVANATAEIDAFVASLADNPDVRTVDGIASAAVTLSQDGSAALITVQTSAGDSIDQLKRDLRSDAEALEAAGLEVGLTSENLLITAVMDDLRDSQVTGLLLTLAASMFILAAAFWVRRRAPMLGVLAIAAVGLVTVWVLGVMALVGIPFNMMTAMISSLAIGIGVPFGIHVVNRFLEERDRELPTGPLSTTEAISRTLSQTGGALIGSAVTTMAGFGVLSLSSIGPMRQFGIVTAMTIGFALVSSLVVLPAMLAIWDRATGEGYPRAIEPERPSVRDSETAGV